MRATHSTTIHARCPRGGWDYYALEMTFVDRLIAVEEIEVLLDTVRGEQMYQEELVEKVRELLSPVAALRCVGRHGNYDTTVTEGVA